MPAQARHSGAEDWHGRLKRDGYACFPRLCPEALVAAARAAIDADLAANFDPARQVEYDHRSYCPDIRSAPPLMALLHESGITAKIDEVLGFDRPDYNPAQIALRKAGVARRKMPLEPHIDGMPTP